MFLKKLSHTILRQQQVLRKPTTQLQRLVHHKLGPKKESDTISTASSVDAVDPDEPVEMKNPYGIVTNKCALCGIAVDYKNAQLLSQFMSNFTGVLYPQENLQLCKKKYEEVEKAIMYSQRAGYLPYLMKEPIFFDDPSLIKRRRK